MGWAASILGGVAGNVAGQGGPDLGGWQGGFEMGWLVRFGDGDLARAYAFLGGRILGYGLDDAREPNPETAYVAFGLSAALPMHLGSRDFAVVLRPAVSLLASRETALNPALWVQGELGVGFAVRVFDKFRLTVLAAPEVWLPATQNDAHLSASLRMGIEHTWTHGGDAERPVSVPQFYRRLEREELHDLLSAQPAYVQCELPRVHSAWSRVEELAATCGEVLGPVEPGSCVAFVGVGHAESTDVDLRAYANAGSWSALDEDDPAASDRAPDHWPVAVLCNFGSDDMTPTVEVERADGDNRRMTVRRYDIALSGERPVPHQRVTPESVEDGEVPDGGCVAVHLPEGGATTTLRLPAVDRRRLRVFAPQVAGVEGTFLQTTTQATIRELPDVDMGGLEHEVRAADQGGAFVHPLLQLRSVIGTPVVLCVEAVP